MGTAYCSHIGWLVGRASATLEGGIHLLKRDSCELLRARIILTNVERSNKTRVDRRSKKLCLACRSVCLGTCGGVLSVATLCESGKAERAKMPLYDHPMSVAVPGSYIAEGRDNGSCICFIWSMTPLAIFAG